MTTNVGKVNKGEGHIVFAHLGEDLKADLADVEFRVRVSTLQHDDVSPQNRFGRPFNEQSGCVWTEMTEVIDWNMNRLAGRWPRGGGARACWPALGDLTAALGKKLWETTSPFSCRLFQAPAGKQPMCSECHHGHMTSSSRFFHFEQTSNDRAALPFTSGKIYSTMKTLHIMFTHTITEHGG